MTDKAMPARALAKRWLRNVASLPIGPTENQVTLTGYVPDIWRDLDVAFRQPVVESIFTNFRPEPAGNWLAARGLLLDPPYGVEGLSEEIRLLVGHLTIQVFNDEAAMLSRAQDISRLWLERVEDEIGIVLLLGALEHEQYAGELPDWFVAADQYELFSIADKREGQFLGDIMTCSRHGRWFVAIPPATIAGMRSSGGGDYAGDRVPRVPRAPHAAGAEALNEPD